MFLMPGARIKLDGPQVVLLYLSYVFNKISIYLFNIYVHMCRYLCVYVHMLYNFT